MVLIRRRLDGREAHAVFPEGLARVVGHEGERVLASLFPVRGHVDAVLPRLVVVVVVGVVLFPTARAVKRDAETEDVVVAVVVLDVVLDVVSIFKQNAHAFRGSGIPHLVLGVGEDQLPFDEFFAELVVSVGGGGTVGRGGVFGLDLRQ